LQNYFDEKEEEDEEDKEDMTNLLGKEDSVPE